MNSLATLTKTMRSIGYACLLLLMVSTAACSLEIVDPAAETTSHAESTEMAIAEVTEPSQAPSPLPNVGPYAMTGPYPVSLEEFLEDRDLIVLAKLGDVKFMRFYGYDSETGEPVEPTRDDKGLSLNVADFILEVEEVLWADETYRPEDPVILRVGWSDNLEDEGVKEWKASFEGAGLKPFETGDRYLFMLRRNPDSTYGVTYDEHRLTVDENGVLYYSQMYPPYPVKHGVFTGGERYGAEQGPPLTVADLVRAAQEMERATE